MKRILSIGIILSIINLPISCDDGCGELVKQETFIDSLSVYSGTYANRQFSAGISDDFRFAAIGIFIEGVGYRPVASNEFYFSFTNSAYACSPVDPEPSQTLIDIKIACKSPVYFNESTYPAHTNLSELFVAYNRHHSQSMSLEQLVTDHQDDPWYFSQEYDAIYLQLKNKPDSALNVDFNIHLNFSDGQEFALTAPFVAIN